MEYSYLDWSEIDVNLKTKDDEEIEFVEFNKAPIKIKELFLKEYLMDYIESQTIKFK